jgi:hypothetical protein
VMDTLPTIGRGEIMLKIPLLVPKVPSLKLKLSGYGTHSGGGGHYVMCVPGHSGVEVTLGTAQSLSETMRKICLVFQKPLEMV